MRKTLALVAAVLPLAFLVGPDAEGNPLNGQAATGLAIQGFYMREPVLNFDVTGSTLLGSFHSRWTVYNDGLVTGSNCGGLNGANGAGTTFASPTDVAKLAQDLANAGAFSLQDSNINVADVPLTTVTVLKGATNARAHTYSYFIATGGQQTVASIISDFLSKYPVSCFSITQ